MVSRRSKEPVPAKADGVSVKAASGYDEAVKAHENRPELSGSTDGGFTCVLVNQVTRALWRLSNEEWTGALQYHAAVKALEGIGPRDPIEGMLAAQMVVTYEAAMECFRRAHLPQATMDARQMNLGQANRLMRSYVTLAEALDRHRGKGQQTVRVEHVTVEAGGQAIVGHVTHPGGGGSGAENGKRAHAPAVVAHERGLEVRGEDAHRQPVPAACGEGEEAL